MITTQEFSTLTDDLCFKYVFSKDIILEDFINSFFNYLKLHEKFESSDIIPESLIMPDNKEHHLYFGNIKCNSIDETIISLEMYKHHFEINDYIKSKAYMCRLFDQNIKKNNYQNAKKVYSINLMTGNFRKMNNELVNTYHFSNSLSHKSLDEKYTIMYLIRFDKVKNLEYNENEKRFITWLRLINAKNLEEMQKYIRKDDEVMNEVIELISKWNKINPKNGFEKYVEQKNAETYYKAKEDGLNEGIIQTAKSMLMDNVELSTIKKYTGLSQKDITNLQKQIKED